MSDADAAAQRFFARRGQRRDALPARTPRRARRALPARCPTAPRIAVPRRQEFAAFAPTAAGEMSTTMAFVRMLANLLKAGDLGPARGADRRRRGRTFGMASLFRQVGIYAAQGQRYEPEDAASLMAYREARDGQILEGGHQREAGALASWTAAATSYGTHGLPMLPFYIYYSMFGFQRVGDLIWAAADQRSRGFLIGATSGRTTLGGEGLQHQDGHSHLMASTVPNCAAYDPAFAYELAVLVAHGMRRMLRQQDDVLLPHGRQREPAQPVDAARRAGASCAASTCCPAPPGCRRARAARCWAADPARGARRCGMLLAADWGVHAQVASVTSFAELARDGMCRERRGWPGRTGRGPYVHEVPRAPPGRSSPPPTTCARCPSRSAPGACRARVRDAGHRRLRPQRHAGPAAQLLRSRSPADRAARVAPARRRGRRGAGPAAGRAGAVTRCPRRRRRRDGRTGSIPEPPPGRRRPARLITSQTSA